VVILTEWTSSGPWTWYGSKACSPDLSWSTCATSTGPPHGEAGFTYVSVGRATAARQPEPTRDGNAKRREPAPFYLNRCRLELVSCRRRRVCVVAQYDGRSDRDQDCTTSDPEACRSKPKLGVVHASRATGSQRLCRLEAVVWVPSAKAATVDAKNAVAATIEINFRMTTFSLYYCDSCSLRSLNVSINSAKRFLFPRIRQPISRYLAPDCCAGATSSRQLYCAKTTTVPTSYRTRPQGLVPDTQIVDHFSARVAGSFWTVRSVSSAVSGASYGLSMPVKFLIHRPLPCDRAPWVARHAHIDWRIDENLDELPGPSSSRAYAAPNGTAK